MLRLWLDLPLRRVTSNTSSYWLIRSGSMSTIRLQSKTLQLFRCFRPLWMKFRIHWFNYYPNHNSFYILCNSFWKCYHPHWELHHWLIEILQELEWLGRVERLTTAFVKYVSTLLFCQTWVSLSISVMNLLAPVWGLFAIAWVFYRLL